MAFDPDKFLAKTAPKQEGGFDPDAFLAKTGGADIGMPDQSIGSGQFGSPFDISEKGPDTFRSGMKQYGKPFIEALPAAGAIGGGLIGAPLGPLGIAGGGAVGAGAGKALENLFEMGLGEKKTTEQLYTDPLKEGAMDLAFAGGAGLLGRGARSLGKAVRGKIPYANQVTKEGADELLEAGQRIGVKPTRGMMVDDARVAKLESSLAQSPTKTGGRYQDQVDDLFGGLQKTGEDVFQQSKGAKSVVGAGEDARQGLIKGVEKRVDETRPFFQQAKAEAEFIDVPSKAKEGFAKTIQNLEYARIKGTPEASLASNISENLKNVKSLKDLKNLRSYVGQSMSDPMAAGSMKKTAGDIYGKLADLEQKAITRASLEAASSKSTGSRIAKEMKAELRQANKLYSQMNKDLQDLAQKSGLGKVKNYSQFIEKVQGMSDEKLAKKLFDPNNVKQLKTMQKQFPKIFEDLRKTKMQDLYNESLTKGELSLPKLLNKVKKMSPESKRLIFGEDAAKKLKDIDTVYNNIPAKVGPSGTPQGEAFKEWRITNPKSWFTEMHDKATAYILENPQSRDLLADPNKGLLRDATRGRAVKGLLDQGGDE